MSDINKIKKPIVDELESFNSFFSSEIKSSARLLNIITKFLLKQKGKQLRPILVFLSAKLCGEVNKSTHSAALLIELMHTATLIHDDVVDVAYKRRGLFSINALWKNKVAVLIGDYFLAKGLLHAVKHKEYSILEIVSDAVKEMSEGELLQIEKARFLDINKEIYFEIIKKKTATLIAAALSAGARSVNADPTDIAKLKELGMYIGIAFQIKDDILDYEGNSGIMGKSAGNDIKEQKITLPLIHLLETSSFKDKKQIKYIIRKQNNNPDKVKWLVNEVISKGGIESAHKTMMEFKDKASKILSEFPKNEAHQSLSLVLDYITQRNK
ncbi:MAG: polyprenyl synthetase family protein [Bacteroidales bacterium]|nr:polyprenyl synthetase family protein [Bacteroidales bacterium]